MRLECRLRRGVSVQCQGIKDEERSRSSAQKVPDLVKKLAKYLPLHFSCLAETNTGLNFKHF